MPNTKDLLPTLDQSKILVYGPSGSGKTSGIRYLPKAYVFDADDGIKTLAGADVDYDTYKDPPMETLIETPRLAKGWRAIMDKRAELIKDCKFQTVVFDSLTTMSDLLMNEIKRVNGTMGQNPQLQEWGQFINKMRDFLASLSSIPATVVVTAHEQYLMDDVSKEIFVVPLIPGKELPGRIFLYFDEVYHTVVERGKRGATAQYAIQTNSDRRFVAKTKLHGLDFLEEWNYEKLVAKSTKTKN